MAITARGHFQTRVQNILSSISHNTLDPPLYTKQFEKEKCSSLVAIFDNGIDPDPSYSGSILARLYIDEELNLSLATWPLDKSQLWRKEILLAHVDSFELEFLGPNSAAQKEKVTPLNANFAWRSQWPKIHTQLPSIIRLKLLQQNEQLQFAFILPTPSDLVTYQVRKI